MQSTAPDHFANAKREMAAQGARLIGSCCGTTPAHIAAVAKAVVDLKPVTQNRIAGAVAYRNAMLAKIFKVWILLWSTMCLVS